MTGFSFIVLSALLFVFFVYLGVQVGSWAGEKAVTSGDYWKMNAVAVLAAVLLTMLFTALPLLYSAIIGMLAGTIVGLKLAFGESVGPWKVIDRFLNVNRSHRKAAENGTGEARRARRKTGEKAPDLISVDSTKKKSR